MNTPSPVNHLESLFDAVSPCIDHYTNYYFYYKWRKEALYHVRRFIILPLALLDSHPTYIQEIAETGSLIFRIEFESLKQFKKLLLSLDPYLDYFVVVLNQQEFDKNELEKDIIQAGLEPESFAFSV
jgi:hypothetical protein